ncbi:uncharacterized protein LOC114909432 [Scleropages formosus]|nr:uncharacterized protein LOC114909432 [Scleropages formosus]
MTKATIPEQLAFGASEGKTLADVSGWFGPTPAPPVAPDLNTKLVDAISSLVEKCQATPMDGLGYRKLRLFSGVKPTPPGEEEYDAWAEQTTHMLDEWQCSDIVKKQRIAESLKGPAADIVRCLRVSNPSVTADDYLKALEAAFGTTDSAADLMVRFRGTFQQEGEKLSAYLFRLDKLLHAVHRKGGAEVADLDQIRIEQVARGALSHDLVAMRIRTMYKLKPPPSFTELLRDVREEEEMILARQIIKEAYEKFQEASDGLAEERRGTVWFTRSKPFTLAPGGVATVIGTPKFPGHLNSQAVVVDHPEEGPFPEGLLVMPVVEEPGTVQCRHLAVTLRNVSQQPVTLKRGMPIAHLFPVDVMNKGLGREETMPHMSQLSPSSFNFGDSPVSIEWKDRLCWKMMERKEVFSCSEFDVGCAKSTQHHIRVTNETPFRERSRRLPPGDLEDVRKHLHDLKEAGIISESRSPYASPIVVVRKKNGTIRMCVDYRTLNRRTIPDQYTVPRVEDALACLSGSQWFSVLDLRSGYYQIPLSAADKEKTTFICPAGFYQFERMPQGICGAPATFQRVMERTVGDMNLLECLVYLDDIIVFGRTLEEHEQRLLKVLDRLKEEGLKLSLDKCQFCCPSVTYLGHVVSRDGIATDPSKVDAVKSWPRPESITALRSFLGFCGYYRRFVKDFSKVCYPLNQLLQGCIVARGPRRVAGAKTASQHGRKPTSGLCPKEWHHPSEPFGPRWDEDCEKAFETLKRSLTEAPVLAIANPGLPYVLHVDASREGLGGVLYQDQGAGLRPVAFVSRSLTPAEKNYPTHKLEFLALKWAITDKLHDYLYGAKFEVHTDNNPLTYVLTTAKLDAAGHRWLAELATYDFSLKYRPGKQNVEADALSRRSHVPPEASQGRGAMPADSVQAICQMSSVRPPRYRHCRAIDLMGSSKGAVPKAYCNLSFLNIQQLPQLTPTDLSYSQQKDPCIGEVWHAVNQKNAERANKVRHPDVSLLLKEWDKLQVVNSVLYRMSKPPNKPPRQQLLLPQEFRETVLQSLHDQSGHLGFEKTYGLLRERFYWPRMKTQVERYCKSCLRCIQRKTLPKRTAELSHLRSDGPMDLVCMDFLTIEPDSSNLFNVLVITDHYTRYAQAFATRDQKAETVAKVLWEKYFIHYGLPKRVHSDQGRDFESRLIHELLGMLGIKKSRTTPYHPQGDPQPERFNRTLLDMLGTLDAPDKRKWGKHIGYLVHAYNCTLNESTGYSPYFLMFGREARLPVDVAFGASGDGTSNKSYTRYVKNMKRELQAAYQLAESVSKKRNEGNKRQYDQRVRYCPLAPGDRVLIRNLGLQGKAKLADRWKDTPYVVEDQLPGLPVFRLKPEGELGPGKVLHRNHILPIGQEVRWRSEKTTEASKFKRRASKRLQTRDESCGRSCLPAVELECAREPESDSEEEETGVWYDCYPQRRSPEPEPLSSGSVELVDLDLGLDVLTNGSGLEMTAVEGPAVMDVDGPTATCRTDVPGDEVECGAGVRTAEEVSEGRDNVAENSAGSARPQRLRRAPTRLTYDKLGSPTTVAVSTHRAISVKVGEGFASFSSPPIRRYTSTLYKWIG